MSATDDGPCGTTMVALPLSANCSIVFVWVLPSVLEINLAPTGLALKERMCPNPLADPAGRLLCIVFEISLCCAVSHSDWRHPVEFQQLLCVASHAPGLLLSVIAAQAIATRQLIPPSYDAEAKWRVVITSFLWLVGGVWSTLATLSPGRAMLNA